MVRIFTVFSVGVKNETVRFTFVDAWAIDTCCVSVDTSNISMTVTWKRES